MFVVSVYTRDNGVMTDVFFTAGMGHKWANEMTLRYGATDRLTVPVFQPSSAQIFQAARNLTFA